MRSLLPFMTGFRAAAVLIVVSLMMATIFDIEDLGLFTMGSTSHETSLATQGGISQSPAPADLMSVMQGHIQVDLLGMQSKAATSSMHSTKQKAKDADDTSHFSGIPITSKIKTRAPDVSLFSMSGGQGATSKVASMLRESLAEVGTSKSSAGLAIVMLLLLIGCTCLAAVSIVYPERFPWNEG